MSAKGNLEFVSINNNVKRIGKTEPLEVSYINNITFKHEFELINFNHDLDFDVLLGVDILPKM
ncbi:hypothetical protein, partial [Streptomyces sundarbansensis]